MPVLSVVLHGQASGQEVNHQRYYEVDTLPANYQGFADAFRALLQPIISPNFFSTLVYTHMIIRPVEVGSIGSIVPFTAGVITGNGAGETLPPFVTARLVLVASATQHPVRGMVQLSGLPETMQNGGLLTSGAKDVLEDVANVFAIDIDAGGTDMWTPVLWSDTYERSAPITGYLVRDNLGTQRRRMPGSGS